MRSYETGNSEKESRMSDSGWEELANAVSEDDDVYYPEETNHNFLESD